MNAILLKLGWDKRDYEGGVQSLKRDQTMLTAQVKDTSEAITLLERQSRAAGGATTAQTTQIKQLRDQLKLLNSDLRSVNAEFKSMGGGSDGHGGGNKAGLAHSGRAMLEMTMAGQSPFQAAQVEAPRVVQAFGGGLGAMLGVGAAFAVTNKIVENISEGIAKARELKSQLMDALRPGPGSGVESIDAMKSRVKELDGVIEAAKPKLGPMERLGQRLSDMAAQTATGFYKAYQGKRSVFSGGGEEAPSEQNAGLREESEERRAELYGKIVAATREENEQKAKGLQSGAQSVRLAENDLKRRRELAAIQEELGIPKTRADIEKVRTDPLMSDTVKKGELSRLNSELETKEKAAFALRFETNKQYAISAQAIERETRAKENAVALEQRLTQAKREGYNVEVQSALARLKDARRTLENGPKDGVEHDANAAKADAAKWDVQVARRTRQEKLAELDIEKQIARLRGTPEQKQALALNLQAAELRRRMSSGRYGADDQEKMGADLAVNAQQRMESNFALLQKHNQTYLAGQEATQGRGPEEARRILQERLNVARAEMEVIAAGHDAGGNEMPHRIDMFNEQAKAAHQLKMAIEDMAYAQEKSLAAMRSQTREMALQQQGATAAARLKGIGTSYGQRIAEAERNNLPQEAEQLREQQRMAEREVEADDEEKGPGGRNRERLKAQRRQRMADRYEKRTEGEKNRKAELDKANQGDFDERFHPERKVKPPPATQPNRRSDIGAGTGPSLQGAAKDFHSALGETNKLLGEIKDRFDFKGK